MQINFYMGDKDRESFHAYVFSRGGYIIPEYFSENTAPIISNEKVELPDTCFLKIYKEDIFSKENFNDSDWIIYNPIHEEYFAAGPGMEYILSYQVQEGMHHGRLYMGLVSHYSFEKPGVKEPDAYQKYADSYRAAENFYRACCRFIRKNFRKDGAGFYHGPESDLMEQERQMKKLP